MNLEVTKMENEVEAFDFAVKVGSGDIGSSCRLVAENMYKEYGFVVLGKYFGGNLEVYDSETTNILHYDFCIPKFDRLIIDLLQEWNESANITAFMKLRERIINIRGEFLVWPTVQIVR